jgi:hypothetical protein
MKWEYRRILVSWVVDRSGFIVVSETDWPELEDSLDRLGAEGWEMTAAANFETHEQELRPSKGHIIYFKRPKL